MSKTFIDSSGLRGKSFVKTIKKEISIRKDGFFRIEEDGPNHLKFTIVTKTGTAVKKVTKRECLQLSHWLLDHCTDSNGAAK